MRTALITGANRGIGLAIGTGLARQEGIKVVLGCRDVMEGQKAAARRHGWRRCALTDRTAGFFATASRRRGEQRGACLRPGQL